MKPLRALSTLSTLLVTATLPAVLVLTPAPALAGPPAAAGFGGHVTTCVRMHGFSGHHNPGHHRGAAGWDGTACAAP